MSSAPQTPSGLYPWTPLRVFRPQTPNQFCPPPKQIPGYTPGTWQYVLQFVVSENACEPCETAIVKSVAEMLPQI